MVWAEAEAHHVPGVAGVDRHLLTSLHVPGGAGHVTGASHDLGVIQEPAAGQVSAEQCCEDHNNREIMSLPCVTRQLPGHAHIALPGLEAVYAANIVQAPENYTH